MHKFSTFTILRRLNCLKIKSFKNMFRNDFSIFSDDDIYIFLLLILHFFGLFVSHCTCYSMYFLGLKMLQIKEKNVYTKSKYIKCLQ